MPRPRGTITSNSRSVDRDGDLIVDEGDRYGTTDDRASFYAVPSFLDPDQDPTVSLADDVLLRTRRELADFIRAKEHLPAVIGEPACRESVDQLYHPLTDSHEIRVFELLPSDHLHENLEGKRHFISIEFEYTSSDAPVAGHTSAARYRVRSTRHGVSLKEGRPVCYTALSYVWGPPEFDSSITINGHRKGITRTLDTALRHLRHTEHSVTLWIDQLCINQNDIKDKESQIKLMALIYQRAWNTVIWLGVEPDGGAFKALEGMHEATRYRDDDLLEDEREYLRRPLNEDPVSYENLVKLLDRPWFKRTWIIQEATLSQQPYIMTGQSIISWSDFAGWCANVNRLGILRRKEDVPAKSADTDAAGQDIDGLHVAAEIWAIGMYHSQFRMKQTMLSMLSETRYAQATNPLDKVYGILGICEDMGIVPDYSLSSLELFHRVAVRTLQNTLEAALHEHQRLGPMSGTYYWAPYQVLCSVDHETSETGLPSTPALTIGDDQMSLNVTGKFFDTVERLSAVFTSCKISEVDPQRVNVSLREATHFAHACPVPHVMAESVFQTLVNTLVAGKDGTGRSKCPGEYTEIFSLLCDETTGRRPSLPDQTYTLRQQKGRMNLANLKTRSIGRAFQGLKQAYSAAVLNRRLCWTRKGYLGLVPRYAQDGDIVCVFSGSTIPFVVRPRGDGNYELVGECYVHDVMNGRLGNDDTVESITIRLI